MNNHNKIRKLNRCGFSFLKNVCLLSEKSIKKTQKWHLACVRYIDAFKNRIVYYFMNQYMKPFIDLEYQGCKKVRHDIDDQNIWVLWLQGEHNMPEIVSLCFQKLQENSSGHNIILLTKGNLNSYLDISANILNRVGKSMSYAAFSDYLRFNLLSLYGGLWIDSTYLVTRPLDNDIFETEFWSLHKPFPSLYEPHYAIISKSKWTGNLMYSSKGCKYIKLCRNLFCNYWDYYDKTFDYFLIDDCIWYIYTSFKEFQALIDSLPITNIHSLSLGKAFNSEWNEKQWNEWISSTQFFKLTYKGDFMKEIHKKLTNYGYLLETNRHSQCETGNSY